MADLTITAASVKWVGGVRPQVVQAGAAITRGQAVYLDPTTNQHKLADADTDATSAVSGIALTDGQAGSDMLIAPPGAVVSFGASLTAGTIYCLSTTPGGVAPWADLAAGDYVVVLAIGAGTANAELIAARGAAVHA